MRNVDKMMHERHWIFAVMPFLNRKWTILSNSTTQYYSKISQFQIGWRVSRNESKISVFIFNFKSMHEN